MATKRRKSTRRKARRSNPRHTALVRSTRSVAHRKHNVSRRKRRQHNPAHSGLLAQGLVLAAGAALVQFTLTFVPPIGGVTPLADAARTAAVGYGLGALMDKIHVGKQYARDVQLAGFTLAGGKLISSFILPFANRLFTPAPAQASQGNGVSGIALVTGTPPQVVAPPIPAPTITNQGMQGVAVHQVPGRFGR